LCPSVVTLHGLHLLRRLSGARRAIAASSLRLIVRAASMTICVSHAEREDVVAAVGAKEGRRVTVIHNGIDIAQAPTATERAAVRAALGLAPEQIVAVFAGSLDRRKDPLVAARAAAAVAADGVPLVLLVAGEGPLAAEVARIETETHGTVRRLGYRDDVQTLLQAADFFVLPSLREGLSYAVLEAMALGLPVVVSDAPGNPEAVGDAGIVVPREDVDAFAGAFHRLLDVETRQSLGLRARDRVRKDFTVETMIESTREIYDVISRAR
jgi:glycosyltransferase involved in cell wall biosynthesis